MEQFVVMQSLYESTILNQQLSYLILEEQYMKEAGFINESSDEGRLASFSEKAKRIVSKFIEVLQNWFSAITKFVTETVPKYFGIIADKIKSILHIKKDAEIIDDIEDCPPAEVKELERITEQVNNTIEKEQIVQMYSVVKPPKIKTGPDEILATKEPEESEEEKKKKEIAAKVKEQREHTVKQIDALAAKTKNPKMKKAAEKAKRAAMSSKPIVVETFKEKSQRFKCNLINSNLFYEMTDSYYTVYDQLRREYSNFLYNDVKKEKNVDAISKKFVDYKELKAELVKKGYTKEKLWASKTEYTFTVEQLQSRIDGYQKNTQEYRLSAKRIEKETKMTCTMLKEAQTKENKAEMKRLMNGCEMFKKSVCSALNDLFDLSKTMYMDAMSAMGKKEPVIDD